VLTGFVSIFSKIYKLIHGRRYSFKNVHYLHHKHRKTLNDLKKNKLSTIYIAKLMLP